MVEKVTIIGSGPAGWTAAIYAARANLQPLVFEGAVSPLGQLNLTTEVENFPAWPHVDSSVLQAFAKSGLDPDRYERISGLYKGPSAHTGQRAAFGPELMEFVRQQAKNFGTRIVSDDIEAVDLSKRPFVLTPMSGEKVETHALIIATGASANYLGLPSEDRLKNRGVSACAVCDGALPLFRNRPLVVIGGGDTAMEEANYLTHFGSKIYLVHRRDEFRASRIMQDRVLNNPKIEVKWNRVVVEVLGENKVSGVVLEDTKTGARETLEAAGMFCAIGHTPNTAFLNGQLETTSKGYLRWTTPARTYTSVEGVFAAGDVADDYYRQAVTAAASGCMSALDAERWLALQDLPH